MLLAEHPTTFCDEQLSCMSNLKQCLLNVIFVHYYCKQSGCIPSFGLVLDLD